MPQKYYMSFWNWDKWIHHLWWHEMSLISSLLHDSFCHQNYHFVIYSLMPKVWHDVKIDNMNKWLVFVHTDCISFLCSLSVRYYQTAIEPMVGWFVSWRMPSGWLALRPNGPCDQSPLGHSLGDEPSHHGLNCLDQWKNWDESLPPPPHSQVIVFPRTDIYLWSHFNLTRLHCREWNQHILSIKGCHLMEKNHPVPQIYQISPPNWHHCIHHPLHHQVS